MSLTIGNTKWLDPIREFFQTNPAHRLGIYVSGQEVWVTQLDRNSVGWQIAALCQCHLLADTTQNAWEDIAEQVKMLCLKENLSIENATFCMHREQIFSYQKTFPAIGHREMREAVHWDLDANVPYAENTYWFDFCRQESAVLLAALPKETGQEILQAFRKAGLCLHGLSLEMTAEAVRPITDGLCWCGQDFFFGPRIEKNIWTEAAYQSFMAAAASLTPAACHINFIPDADPQNQWNWRRLSAAVFLLTAGVLSLFYGISGWQLYQLNQALTEETQQTALLKTQKETMDRLTVLHEEKNAAVKRLSALSGERISPYGILVQLGLVNVDGVCLSAIALKDDRSLQLKGTAESYALLAQYMQNLETDAELFPSKPMLVFSGINEQNQLVFTIQMTL